MLETLLGGLMGGVFRLIPEGLKFFDRKNERAHELSMLDKNLELDKLRGDMKLAELNATNQGALDTAGLQALIEGIKAQGQPSGVKWVDALNTLMRPVITFQWVILLYPIAIIAQAYLLTQTGVPGAEAIVRMFGDSEKAMCAGIINFWFLDRVVKHQKR